MLLFRARGHYRSTNRDSWVTTVWRGTRKEAEDDIACYAPLSDYSAVWLESRGV